MVEPTNETISSIDSNATPQPLTKKLFVKLTAKRITKRDGSLGYVMSSQDAGKPCTFQKGEFKLDYAMKKKEAWTPNQAKNESGFEFEAWLFNDRDDKEQAFQELATFFPSKLATDDFVYLYMNMNDENMLLNEQEYLQLPS